MANARRANRPIPRRKTKRIRSSKSRPKAEWMELTEILKRKGSKSNTHETHLEFIQRHEGVSESSNKEDFERSLGIPQAFAPLSTFIKLPNTNAIINNIEESDYEI